MGRGRREAGSERNCEGGEKRARGEKDALGQSYCVIPIRRTVLGNVSYDRKKKSKCASHKLGMEHRAAVEGSMGHLALHGDLKG